MTTPSQPGRLYGVGVGPGDPELLTVKAQRVLQSVPVIWVPQAGRRYAFTIVKDIIDELFPTNDEEAAGDTAARDHHPQDVAFITEGDPMTAPSRTCWRKYPHLREVVPMAAAASAAAPLVHGQRLAILPAVYGIDDLREAIALYDTIVLMKVNRTLLDALANLERLGLAGAPSTSGEPPPKASGWSATSRNCPPRTSTWPALKNQYSSEWQLNCSNRPRCCFTFMCT